MAFKLPSSRGLIGPGKLVSRAPFLAGTVRSYFAPGQDEDAVHTYANPTGWRPAGGLLTMPQVVWLSCLVPQRLRVNYDSGTGVKTLGEADPFLGRQLWDATDGWSINYWYEVGAAGSQDWIYQEFRDTITVGSTGISGNIYNGVAGQFVDLRSSLKAAFDGAKATIEAARPDQTWVEVIDWVDPPAATPWPFGTGFYPHLLAPTSSDDFLGVDFLHIYCGSVVRDHLWDNGDSTTTPVRDFILYDRPHDSDYAAAVSRLATAYPRFYRHAAKLYGYDLSFSQSTTAGADNDFAPSGDTATFSSTNANALLQAEATALAAYGYTYEGLGDALTASSLAQVIADHFGFAL